MPWTATVILCSLSLQCVSCKPHQWQGHSRGGSETLGFNFPIKCLHWFLQLQSLWGIYFLFVKWESLKLWYTMNVARYHCRKWRRRPVWRRVTCFCSALLQSPCGRSNPKWLLFIQNGSLETSTLEMIIISSMTPSSSCSALGGDFPSPVTFHKDIKRQEKPF